jgi:hypothetical protein
MRIGVFTVLDSTDIYLVENSDLNVGFKVNNRQGQDYDLTGKKVRFQAKTLDFDSDGSQITIQDAIRGIGYLTLLTVDTGILDRETNYRFDVVEGSKNYPFAFGRIILIPYY